MPLQLKHDSWICQYTIKLNPLRSIFLFFLKMHLDSSEFGVKVTGVLQFSTHGPSLSGGWKVSYKGYFMNA